MEENGEQFKICKSNLFASSFYYGLDIPKKLDSRFDPSMFTGIFHDLDYLCIQNATL